MMNKKLLALVTLTTFPFFAAAEEIRDPFAPFSWGGPAQADNINNTQALGNLDATPLTKDPISSYQLAGVIVSPTDSIALVRAKNKRDYFANIGDSIGNEGGIIDVISTEGITVDINGKLIDLTVSNRFDIQNDSD